MWKLLIFVAIGVFFVWLCHKADADYIDANADDSTELIERGLFGDDDE